MDQKLDADVIGPQGVGKITIVVAGPEGVGKTSVVKSLIGEKVKKKGYPSSTEPKKEDFTLNGKRFEIWDASSPDIIPKIVVFVLDLSRFFYANHRKEMLENHVPNKNKDDKTQICFIINQWDHSGDFHLFSVGRTLKLFHKELEEKGYKNVPIISYSAHYQKPENTKRKNPIWDVVLERPIPVKEQKPTLLKRAKEVLWKRSSDNAPSVDGKDKQERLKPVEEPTHTLEKSEKAVQEGTPDAPPIDKQDERNESLVNLFASSLSSSPDTFSDEVNLSIKSPGR